MSNDLGPSTELFTFSATASCLLILLTLYILLHVKRILYMKWISAPIPQPPGSWIPFVGHAMEIGRTSHCELLCLLLKWATKYGQVYKVWMFHKLYIIISCPQLMQKILSSPTHITKSSDYDILSPWLGEGLLTSNGLKWQNRRKLLGGIFLNTKFLEHSLKVLNQNGRKLTRKLQSKLKCNDGFNIMPLMTESAFSVICETGMAVDSELSTTDRQNYLRSANRITEIIYKKILQPWRTLPIIKLFCLENYEERRCIKSLHEMTRKIIDERQIRRAKSELESGSFLDILLSMDDLPSSGMVEEVNTFLFGGHDTIAANLCWTILNLAGHQDCQMTLQKELDFVLEGCNNDINKEQLSQMKYLECCIKETLRLFPSVPAFNRKLLQNVDEHLPQGAILSFNVFLMHRNPEIFDDPEAFKPDRFLYGKNDFTPYSYLPFSGGPRNCTGKKFAVMEEMVLLALLFYNYEFSLAEESQLDLNQLQWDLVLRPVNGANVRIKRRH